MNMMIRFALLLASAGLVLGHGRVTDPPSRATAWRFNFNTPKNYDVHGMNCGGFGNQYRKNGGKCGICGDPYQLPTPRPHEYNGSNYAGVIVRKYLPGAIIKTTTEITVFHKGYWEFKLCTDHTSNQQECFDKHTLELESGETRYYPTRNAAYDVKYKLPAGLTCKHCVLQWRYVDGNSWGRCKNGTEGLGCGDQEEFRACSDIAILPEKGSLDYDEVGNVDLDVDNYLDEQIRNPQRRLRLNHSKHLQHMSSKNPNKQIKSHRRRQY